MRGRLWDLRLGRWKKNVGTVEKASWRILRSRSHVRARLNTFRCAQGRGGHWARARLGRREAHSSQHLPPRVPACTPSSLERDPRGCSCAAAPRSPSCPRSAFARLPSWVPTKTHWSASPQAPVEIRRFRLRTAPIAAMQRFRIVRRAVHGAFVHLLVFSFMISRVDSAACARRTGAALHRAPSGITQRSRCACRLSRRALLVWLPGRKAKNSLDVCAPSSPAPNFPARVFCCRCVGTGPKPLPASRAE